MSVVEKRMQSSAASANEAWSMHIAGSVSLVYECLIQDKCYISDGSGQEQETNPDNKQHNNSTFLEMLGQGIYIYDCFISMAQTNECDLTNNTK